jgi:hypothetical protein
MCSDHPEFRARRQMISVMHVRACNFWRAGWDELEIQRSKSAATANFSDRKDT